MAIRVGINGFGRIGRAVARLAFEQYRHAIDIVHINDLTPLTTCAHLFENDSIHGTFKGEVVTEGDCLMINGQKIIFSADGVPEQIKWRDVDVVLECSGVFRKREQAAQHLANETTKWVVISAPASDEDFTVVYGVNSDDLDPKQHRVISNGSCTTNCLAPPLKVIDQQLGIKRGFMTTVHSYTSDQRLLDLSHGKDLRRARAAATNMIPTSTGAAKAIGLVLPNLRGKIDGLAIRVPTPNVSLVDTVLELDNDTTVAQVNSMLVNAASNELRGVLACEQRPLVSSDFNGNSASSIIDLPSTSVVDGKLLKLLAWYDNEIGFSCRMLDVIVALTKE